ncbi:MAG: RAD55 family ATPase [Candidatus Thorarchaeota archaeon]
MARRKDALPPEFPILRELNTGYSIVIKGQPGTGKSTLALEMVAALSNSFFISSRINPKTILQDSPWILSQLSKHRSSPFFIDATRSSDERSERNIQVLKYETMPEFVQQLFSLGEELANKVIVIDSWNALTINLTSSQISHWESVIVQHLRAENSKIIFIMEGIQDTSLDWVVDGIAILSKRSITSPQRIARRVRELSFPKMRGREIQNETYLTTLYKGRFQTFFPFVHRFPAIMIKPSPIGDPDDQHISSGSVAFDELFGGFLKGSWNLFEATTAVGGGFELILFPLLTNQLVNERPIVSVFREGVTLDARSPFLDVFTGTKTWIQKTVNFERFIPENAAHRAELPETIEELLSQFESARENLSPTNGGPCLINLGLDVLENKYGIPALQTLIAILVSKARLRGDIVVGFLQEKQQFRGGTAVATSQWKIDLIDRALVLEGIIPATEYYAIEPVLYKGYVDYTVTPIQ